MRKKLALVAVILVMVVLGFRTDSAIHSQTTEQACQTLVTEALQVVGSACAGIGNNEACYGYNQVAATFRGNVNPPFGSRGDLVTLTDLQALFTLPADPFAGTWGVALMTVTADLPAQGAPLTLVLMGDTQITDTETSPALVPCNATNTGNYNVNIRSGPGTNYSVAGVFVQGGTATVNGRNTAGDWVNITYQGQTGWILASLVSLDCFIDELPVTEGGTPGRTPMQAITIRSGAPGACDNAPNGLMVRSPEGQRATIYVNGVEMTFSSAAFISARPNNVMAVDGLDGTVDLRVGTDQVQVQAGTTSLVPLTELEASGPPSPPQPTAPSFQTILPTINQMTETLQQNGIGADACVAVANRVANTRNGPGTVYTLRGALNEGEGARIEAQATGVDGFQWWRLLDGSWVRSDVVDVSGNCSQLPVIFDLPPTPTPLPYTPTPTPTNTPEPERYIEVTACYGGGGVFSETVRANRSLRAGCYWDFANYADANDEWDLTMMLDGGILPTNFGVYEGGRWMWQGRTSLSPGQHTFVCELYYSGGGYVQGSYHYASCTVTAQ